ncbi:MAG: hypothetical protein DHS20C20_07030 [Ardenticatenaceae bacterium]|nr:MAG: hypothetical protein DHS20C20_07030 [Ardenticatenaceae bacterium]
MSKRKPLTDVMGNLQGLPPKREEKRPELPFESAAPTSLPTPARPSRQDAPTRGKKKRSTSKERLARRVTYEIGKELKEAIHQEATRIGVPDSQLAKYLLLYAWNYYLDGEIPDPMLVESKSAKYRNNIEFE